MVWNGSGQGPKSLFARLYTGQQKPRQDRAGFCQPIIPLTLKDGFAPFIIVIGGFPDVLPCSRIFNLHFIVAERITPGQCSGKSQNEQYSGHGNPLFQRG